MECQRRSYGLISGSNGRRAVALYTEMTFNLRHGRWQRARFGDVGDGAVLASALQATLPMSNMWPRGVLLPY